MSRHSLLVAVCFFSCSIWFAGCGGGESSQTTADNGSAESTSDDADRGDSDSGRSIDNNANPFAELSKDTEQKVKNAEAGGRSASSGNDQVEQPNTEMASLSDEGFGGALFPPKTLAEVAAVNTGRRGIAEGGDSGGEFANNRNDGGEEPNSDPDPFDLGDDFHSETKSSSSETAPTISLLLDARRLFDQHNEKAAISYLYANHLISDESRKKYQLNWYSGLKEPRLFFRWGVGVIYNQSRDVQGRHPVIGDPGDENENVSQSSQNNSRRGNTGFSAGAAGGSGGRGPRTYKNIDTSRPDGFLMYYTGDFGERLIKYLDSRREDEQRPYYGQLLKDVMEVELPQQESEDANRASRANVSRRGGPAASASGFQGGQTGRGGVSRGRTNRNSRNRNSNAQPLQRTDTSVIDRAMGNSTAERPEDDFSGSIMPGVQLLGKGSKAELIDRARSANVDALFLFNVKISKSRGSRNRRNSAPSSTNTTSMKIVDLKTEDNIFSSKSLKDVDVNEKNDEGEDPVKEQMDRAFKNIADEQFKAVELPSSINESNVKKRIGSLLKSKPDPLRAAVEIVSFYEAKLLSADLANKALTRLFDDDQAAVLIDGTPLERLNFLRDKLPEGAGE